MLWRWHGLFTSGWLVRFFCHVSMGRPQAFFPKSRRPAICLIRLCMSPGGGRGGGWTPLYRGEHCKGLVAVGHLWGMTLRAGCSACPCRGMWLPIPPGRHMYALHLTGPELPTRLGMLSISVLMVHYAQRRGFCLETLIRVLLATNVSDVKWLKLTVLYT